MSQQATDVDATEETADDGKRSLILDAAVEEFSARGFSGTSMANIADAAGMSRPALYQHFKNKSDIFVSAFTAMIDAAVDRALAELAIDQSTGERLDGMLQRFDGDLWERMAASPHSEELLATAAELAVDRFPQIGARLWLGLADHLERIEAAANSGDPATQRNEWIDMLKLAPKGFKSDQPSVETYRRRLRTLAHSVAADIDH